VVRPIKEKAWEKVGVRGGGVRGEAEEGGKGGGGFWRNGQLESWFIGTAGEGRMAEGKTTQRGVVCKEGGGKESAQTGQGEKKSRVKKGDNAARPEVQRKIATGVSAKQDEETVPKEKGMLIPGGEGMDRGRSNLGKRSSGI